VEEITGIIQSSGERLSGFMNDAIQMTTLGSAESLLKLQPVPVNELLSECLGPIQAMARRREITIHDLLNGKVDWVLLCDPGVLQVGLAKILQNAVQHNRDGGVIIIREASTVPGEGAIHEIVTREGVRRMESQPGFEEFADEELRWKILEIFNTGNPIPEEKRAALFGKFEVLGPIENHQKGTGLSLPIAKAALESHGGGVYLHCDETDGNTFYLLLPVLKVSPGSRAASRVQDILAGNQQGQSPVSTAWDEDICEVADATPFDVEFEDQCASILGCIDEAGSRVDRAGSADDKKKVTITSDSE
jgi:signal transduction histidine kinase